MYGQISGCSFTRNLKEVVVMVDILLASAAILPLAIVMSMTGRGGGNFYVPILLVAGTSVHEAATISQLILVFTALAAVLVFQKNKTVDWKLALIIDPPTDIMAFIGGYYAHQLGGTHIKLLLTGLLVLSSFLMLHHVTEKPSQRTQRVGFWHRTYGKYTYTINLWLAIPVTAATGFVAGMVGISGGSFKIPLMVLACGVPMRIAVGTSSAMVAATALMGFLGHIAGGDLYMSSAIPIAAVALLGGAIGGRISLKTSPKNLKQIFAYSTLAAAIIVLIKTVL
jgi:hypothetical protein